MKKITNKIIMIPVIMMLIIGIMISVSFAKAEKLKDTFKKKRISLYR